MPDTDAWHYTVKVTRTVTIFARNAAEAGERALNLIQRQQAWPEDMLDMLIEVNRATLEGPHDDE